jgi:hypothetical protein
MRFSAHVPAEAGPSHTNNDQTVPIRSGFMVALGWSNPTRAAVLRIKDAAQLFGLE